jgi:hypothetical protein
MMDIPAVRKAFRIYTLTLQAFTSNILTSADKKPRSRFNDVYSRLKEVPHIRTHTPTVFSL